MNQFELETKIEGLKKAIAEHNDFAGTYTSDLAKTEQELKDINKPQLTPLQLDDIQEAIEAGIEDFDLCIDDATPIDPGIEYNLHEGANLRSLPSPGSVVIS